MGDDLGPWWVGIGASIVTSLGAVIGKLWTELRETRKDAAATIAQKDYELSQANARIVELQDAAAKRGIDLQRDHLRDLRRLAGLSHSIDPPPADWPPPVVIREAPGARLPPPRKRGG